MNFAQHILSLLISAARGGARGRYRLAVCILSAAAAASPTYFQPRRAQAQQTPTTLHGAAALEQLKRDGQYESLQAAMDQARFSVNRTAHTPLGRAAWHAPNLAAGYDAYVTEAGVIEAEDHEAAYPLTIDRLFTLQQKLLAADGAADDRLGWSVALSGNTALVGAPYDDGAGGISQACPPSTLAPDSLPSGNDGVPYRQVMTVSGDAGRYQIALGNGALPPGLTLDRDGVLAGTPMGAGAYRFILTVTDIVTGCVTTREYTLEINLLLSCPTLTVAPAALPNGTTGVAYSQAVTVTGGTAPYTFGIRIRSTIPPGMSFLNGVLSGTPTRVGTFSFGGPVKDANDCQGQWGYSVTIKDAAAFVSAASYQAGVTPESIVAAFGAQLSTQSQAASGLPLPTELAGVRVLIRDNLGVERLAPLFFVSPSQLNLQIPADTATGPATVSISNGSLNSGATSQIEIARTAPGVFTANADGQGVPAAVFLRVRNGAQSYEPAARLEGNRFVPAPLIFNSATEQVFLVLFGTGLRFGQTVTASVGGMDVSVLFAGAAAGFPGLDQVNVLLPFALRGRGDVDVVLRVDRAAANTVRINVR